MRSDYKQNIEIECLPACNECPCIEVVSQWDDMNREFYLSCKNFERCAWVWCRAQEELEEKASIPEKDPSFWESAYKEQTKEIAARLESKNQLWELEKRAEKTWTVALAIIGGAAGVLAGRLISVISG